jgi:Cu+-exporting ATPase
VVFDKTGTITEGRPWSTDHRILPLFAEARLADLVDAAEAGSEHFLARALAEWCRPRRQRTLAADEFVAHPGRGVSARIDGCDVLVGNAALLTGNGIAGEVFATEAGQFAEQGKTPVFVAVDGQIAAVFAIADRPRDGAADAIATLHRLGLPTVMATGDLEPVARHVAQLVGIDRVIARARRPTNWP